MGKLRFYFALWMAKLSVPALKITRHNGTDFPGTLALKLCPDFLKYVGRPKTIIAVTGTNGKTTVSNLLADTLEKEGHRVLINRAGSNVASGIATALLKGCDLAGRVKNYDMAVLEVDERSSVRVYPYITPDYIADIISRSVPASSRLVLNADDLISCGLAPENERVYFGIDRLPTDTVECVNHINDVRICPKCAGKLRYESRRYHHIGRAVCQDCGFHSPDSDYLATHVDIAGGAMTIREKGKEYPYTLISDSVGRLPASWQSPPSPRAATTPKRWGT